MTSATDALYHALIVEHDRTPRNEGSLANATHAATLDNPLCGDIVTVRVIVERSSGDIGGERVVDGSARVVGADRVVDAKFEARGCALCRAAASMMTTRVAGVRVDEADALVARFEAFVANASVDAMGIDANAGRDDDDPALGDLVAFRGVQAVRSRRTCATLPFRALAAALLER